MARVTQFRAHPDLVEVLIDNSLETLAWMRDKGVRFQPSYGRQAFKPCPGLMGVHYYGIFEIRYN